MTLEINPEWVTFNLYTHPDPADPTSNTGTKLYPQMPGSADRYLALTEDSRDLFSMSIS